VEPIIKLKFYIGYIWAYGLGLPNLSNCIKLCRVAYRVFEAVFAEYQYRVFDKV